MTIECEESSKRHCFPTKASRNSRGNCVHSFSKFVLCTVPHFQVSNISLVVVHFMSMCFLQAHDLTMRSVSLKACLRISKDGGSPSVTNTQTTDVAGHVQDILSMCLRAPNSFKTRFLLVRNV